METGISTMSLISRAEGHYSAVCDSLVKILGGRRLESSMLGSSERQLANAGLGGQPSSLVAVQTGMFETMFPSLSVTRVAWRNIFLLRHMWFRTITLHLLFSRLTYLLS